MPARFLRRIDGAISLSMVENVSHDVLRWGVVGGVALLVFANHYGRDTVGAMEKQLEDNLAVPLTASDYNVLNSLYFFPNIITPLLAGILAKRTGGPERLLVYCLVLAAVGHFFFALGGQISSTFMMYFGRSMAGLVYEVIDTLPVMFLFAIMKDRWTLVVGVNNAFLRLGSILTFVLCPVIYSSSGLITALWVNFFIASIGIGAAWGTRIGYETLTDSDAFKLVRNAESEEDGLEMVAVPGGSNGGEEGVAVEELDEEEEEEGEEKIVRTRQGGVGTSDSNFIENDGKAEESDSIYSAFAEFPWVALGTKFWMFTLAGSFLYGSMVPFWFMGSKYLQVNYGLSMSVADMLMFLPEGMIVIVAIPLGYCSDSYQWTIRTKLRVFVMACCVMATCYIVLTVGFDTVFGLSDGQNGQPIDGVPTLAPTPTVEPLVLIPPVVPMLLIGISYATSNTMYWALLPFMMPKRYLNQGSGMIGSAMNVLPSIVPWFIAANAASSHSGVISSFGFHVLTALGFFAGVFAWIASMMAEYEDKRNENTSVRRSELGGERAAEEGMSTEVPDDGDEMSVLDDEGEDNVGHKHAQNYFRSSNRASAYVDNTNALYEMGVDDNPDEEVEKMNRL